jgi:hypothetical protein
MRRGKPHAREEIGAGFEKIRVIAEVGGNLFVLDRGLAHWGEGSV